MALTKAQLIDLNANELIVDLDADTSITADTDDQIDIKIAGADDFRFTANTFTALSGSTITGPTIVGSTSVQTPLIEFTDGDDAMTIADGGVVTFSQTPVLSGAGLTAGTTPLTTLDIDGATDIGAAVADADLFIIDDGAGGTNRKVTASRVKTYMGAEGGAFSVSNLDIDGATDIGAGIADADLFIIDDGAGGTNRKTAASRIKTYIADVTLTTAAQTNITSLGTLTALTVDDMTLDGSTISDSGDFTIDGGADIILDADGGDIFFKDAGTTFGSATNTSGNLIIKSGTTTAATFSGANVTLAGTVGSGAITSTSTIQGTNITATTAFVPDAANGASLGTTSLEFADLYLHDGGIVYFGADQDVELAHVADVGLTLKTATTSDDTKATLTLQTGETDIAINDVLGQLHFQAPDEAAGTDAILVAAGIAAVSEGDFSASNNATKLSFLTGASEAASEKMSLSSAGLLTVADDLIIKNAGTIGTAADSDLLTMGNAILTVAGEVSMTTLDIGGTNVTSTATELNKLDGVGTLKQAGKETIWVPSVAMYPSNTSGCAALAGTELASDINRPFLQVLAFDKDSDEAAQFSVAFPKSWNEGTITFQPFFTANTTNTGDVKFMLKGIALSDNDALNTDFGTAQGTAKSHSGTAYDLNVGAESSAITIAGSPAAGDQVFFQIFRDVSADNMSADALLTGIKIHFTTDAANDA